MNLDFPNSFYLIGTVLKFPYIDVNLIVIQNSTEKMTMNNVSWIFSFS